MSQAQPAAAPAAPKPKRQRKPAAARTHPAFLDMVKDAIVTLKDKNGSSRQAICKVIMVKHPSVNPDKMNTHVRKALKRGLQTGLLTRPARSSATGATGKFKLGEIKSAKPVKKKAVKKPAKKQQAKKASASAGPAKKAAKAKSPKKKKAAAGKKKTADKKATKPKTKKASPKKKTKAATKPKKVAKKPKVKKTPTKKTAAKK